MSHLTNCHSNQKEPVMRAVMMYGATDERRAIKLLLRT